MKDLMKWASMAMVLLGLVSVTQAYALPVVNTDNLQLSVGGLIQAMGETEYVSDDTVGNQTRLYLWNVADQLYISGAYSGFDWRLATTYGGTTNAASASNLNGILDTDGRLCGCSPDRKCNVSQSGAVQRPDQPGKRD